MNDPINNSQINRIGLPIYTLFVAIMIIILYIVGSMVDLDFDRVSQPA